MVKKNIPKDVFIKGSRVYVENGEVKTQLSDGIRKSRYMSVDEMYHLIDSRIKMLYELMDEL